jgi:hypothetical protein
VAVSRPRRDAHQHGAGAAPAPLEQFARGRAHLVRDDEAFRDRVTCRIRGDAESADQQPVVLRLVMRSTGNRYAPGQQPAATVPPVSPAFGDPGPPREPGTREGVGQKYRQLQPGVRDAADVLLPAGGAPDAASVLERDDLVDAPHGFVQGRQPSPGDHDERRLGEVPPDRSQGRQRHDGVTQPVRREDGHAREHRENGPGPAPSVVNPDGIGPAAVGG